jgi:hypothetical protein
MNNYIDLPEEGGAGGGVSSLNGLSGALTLVAGTGITITPAGSTIEISSTSTGGTVTAVGLADSTGLFNITGSPVTTVGTLTLASFKSQSANMFLAAPNGSAGSPTFRLIAPADVPTLNQNTTGTASNITATTNSTLTTLSALTTASSLSAVGTITSGMWQGSTIAISEGGTGQITASSAINALVPSQTGNTGKVLGTNGTVVSWVAPSGSGTVTSVGLSDSTGIFNITGSPVTGSGTLTLASLQSQSANTFLAAPNGSAGTPTFRTIVGADVPTLNQNTTGTASNITATTNSTLTTLSALSLPGAQVTGNISGTASNITATTNSTLTTLSALSLPGSQVTGNISGEAANVTGIVGIANGGTNLSTTPTSGQLLIGNGTNYTLSTLTAGTGIAVANSVGGITISTTGTTATATKSANYTILSSDSIIFCNTSGGPFTLTLPSPSAMAGKVYRIIDSTGSFQTNNLTLAPNASESIEGLAASKVLQTAWGFFTVTTDGTNWFVG